jgi:hypothetical protein
MFRRHPLRSNQGVNVVKKTSEGRRKASSLRKDGSTRDLTESTAHDLGSSLSQLELRRNKSYETEDSPVTTLASSTAQPTTSGESDDNDRQKQVDYVAAAMMHSPPPESVSLMRSGCSCSELSEDNDSGARRDKPLPNANEQEAGGVNVQVAQPPAAAADAFVPPEFIYLTPDNCWPLEL